MYEASILKWYSQKRSDVVHFYRDIDSNKNPIPLCKCVQKGMDKDPEHTGAGFVLMHAMGKRVHSLCLRKVSDEVRPYYENPPP